MDFSIGSVFDNQWHSSDPGGSEVFVIRLILTFYTLVIRFYSKRLKETRKAIPWDDISIVPTFISSIVEEDIALWGELVAQAHFW
jgi:hypothetical protein